MDVSQEKERCRNWLKRGKYEKKRGRKGGDKGRDRRNGYNGGYYTKMVISEKLERWVKGLSGKDSGEEKGGILFDSIKKPHF